MNNYLISYEEFTNLHPTKQNDLLFNYKAVLNIYLEYLAYNSNIDAILDVKYTGQGGTFVEKIQGGYYGNGFRITIDLFDTYNYALENSISMLSAAKLLALHEIYHVIYNHINLRQPNINPVLSNYAEDLEINSKLGIKSPGLTPSRYGFPEELTAEEYIELLKDYFKDNSQKNNNNQDNSQNNNTSESIELDDGDSQNDNESNENNSGNNSSEDNEDNQEDSQNDGNSTSSSSSEISKEVEEQLEKELNEAFGSLKIEDVIDKDIEEQAEDFNDYLKYEYEKTELTGKFNDIVNSLKPIENAEKTKAAQQYSYFKYNRKNYGSNLIRPGKIKQHQFNGRNTRTVYEKIILAFVDFSGSTEHMNLELNDLVNSLRLKGCRIVIYNDNLLDIIEPTNNDIRFYPSDGGTEIKRVLYQYKKDYGNFERAIVFTDGKDDFDGLQECTKHADVYHIEEDGHIFKEISF